MTKRKQNIISLLFLLLMAVIVVCGCGGTDADSVVTLPQENTEHTDVPDTDAEEQTSLDASAEQQDNANDSKTTEPQKSTQANTEKQNVAAPMEQKPVAQPTTKSEPKKEATCTISISCATILEHMDLCDPTKSALIPQDGWILKPTKVTIQPDETVFAVLQRTCKAQKIPMEFEDTPMYNSAYIEGIYNLYEFDAGDLSGWMYSVNGWFPNYGCSQYKLQDGDIIKWMYTCDLGEDVGGSNAV